MFSAGGVSTNRRKAVISAVFQPENFDDIADVSPDPSPLRPSKLPTIPARNQRLATTQHAQRQIKKLTSSLYHEKKMRMGYKRRLESSPGYVYDENEPSDDVKLKHQVTSFRGRTRNQGSQGKGSTLSHRLRAAGDTPSSNHGAAFESSMSPPPPVPSIPGQFQGDETDLLESSEGEGVQVQQLEVVPSSPPPLASPSNRASVDGMDPVYANVLRRSALTAHSFRARAHSASQFSFAHHAVVPPSKKYAWRHFK